jgi:negative regulator of sigma E activity
MTAPDAKQRLEEAALAAHDAEAREDFTAANEAWRRYRLIGDTLRDPDELLAEGVAISERARALAG